MRKPEIKITCLFEEAGESAQKILLRSFCLYLRRELERDGQKLYVQLNPDEILST